MTAEASHAILADSALFADIVDILSNVTGLPEIAPDARLETDLRMESIELVAFGDELRRRHGDRIDLAGYLAALELDELVALSVADVVRYVGGSADRHGANLPGGTGR